MLVLYGDTGKENGKYYLGFRLEETGRNGPKSLFRV